MKKALKYTIIFVAWIGIWYGFSALCNINSLLHFPYPHEVISTLFQLLKTTTFYSATGLSLLRILIGIIIAILLGVILAVISSLSSHIYDFFKPFLAIVKSTPVVAFIFLVFVVVGSDMTPIVICSLMVIPVVYSNVYQGIKKTDTNLLEVCSVYKLSFGKKLYSVYIPSVLPYFVSSLISSVGLGWKAGVAAEVLCATKKSIGIEIFNAKSYLEYANLFAWTLTVIILSLILESAITYLLKLISKKYLSYSEVNNENS